LETKDERGAEGDIPCMTTMRESHEVRAGGDERDAVSNNLLRIIIDHSQAAIQTEPEGLELQGIGVDVIVPMYRRSMNADFRTARKVMTRWKGDSFLGDDLFHDAATDEAPHPHAFAQDAVERDHAGKSFLGPFSTSGLEFVEDFEADMGEHRGQLGVGSEVQSQVREGYG